MNVGRIGVVAISAMVAAPIMYGATIFENGIGLALSRVPANIREAHREKTMAAKALKAVTGWSLLDMNRYGSRGGPNSIFNRPLGTIGAQFGFDWRPFGVPKPLTAMASAAAPSVPR